MIKVYLNLLKVYQNTRRGEKTILYAC